MGKLFVLRCVRGKHGADLHSTNGERCRGYLDGNHQLVAGDIKRGWDYCSCYRARPEIEETAESRRFVDLDREGGVRRVETTLARPICVRKCIRARLIFNPESSQDSKKLFCGRAGIKSAKWPRYGPGRLRPIRPHRSGDRRVFNSARLSCTLVGLAA